MILKDPWINFEEVENEDIKNLKFPEPKEFEGNFEKMDKIMMRYSKLLDLLYNKEIPNNSISEDEILSIANDLIKKQRNNSKILKPGNWALEKQPDYAPFEYRVDYVFFPTYISMAILLNIFINHNNLIKNKEIFVECVERGMIFLNEIKFQGHGYDSTRQMMEALTILSKGYFFEFLSKNQIKYKNLYKLIVKIKSFIDKSIEFDDTDLGWGGGDKKEEMLYLQDQMKIIQYL